MLQLTRHQSQVGSVLQDGNYLIVQRSVSSDEENEIRLQMSLLNERWEELRVRAMSKQARLQQVLMELQQAQLDRLAEWLTDMEQKISQHGPIASDLDTIQSQVDTHKVSASLYCNKVWTMVKKRKG